MFAQRTGIGPDLHPHKRDLLVETPSAFYLSSALCLTWLRLRTLDLAPEPRGACSLSPEVERNDNDVEAIEPVRKRGQEIQRQIIWTLWLNRSRKCGEQQYERKARKKEYHLGYR